MATQSIGTQKSADLGWITIGYDEAGSGAPPMVLLHGAGAGATSSGTFAANIPVLAKHYRVIAMDLPGFGRSDAYVMTTEDRQTVNARAICGLMDALGIEKANLVGNSLGGGAALATAVDFPGRVNRLVLMGCSGYRTPMFGAEPTEGIKALQAVYRDLSQSTFRTFFDIMLYDGSKVSDAVLAERAGSVRQEQVDAWIESYKSPRRSLAPDLARVVAPTLLMHGRNDRVVSFEGSLSLLTDLPNSELHAFNQCGHWVQYEHAESFNELVLNFMARP
jgi:2-hydroxy-6-oxonona-2,4-dienedioate hydrolase